MGIDNRFSAKVKRDLRLQVGSYCSAPFCGIQTSVYDLNIRKPKLTGDAAHICGAKEGAARYADIDKLPNGSTRDGADNGIWLCTLCHRMIDNNSELFPVQTLLAWKCWAIQTHQNAGRTRRIGVTIGADVSREHKKASEFLKEVLRIKDLFWHGRNWAAVDETGTRRYLDLEVLDLLWRRAGIYSAIPWNAHHPQWSFLPDLRLWQDEIVRMAKTLTGMPGIRQYDRDHNLLYFIKDDAQDKFVIHDDTTRALEIFSKTLIRFEEYLERYSGPQQIPFFADCTRDLQ